MRERAGEWLESAEVNIRAAEKLGDDAHLSRAAVFHAHRCAEKSLKAILEDEGERVPEIHNLATLTESIRALGLDPAVDEDVLDEMNQVYIESRYPADLGLLPGGTLRWKLSSDSPNSPVSFTVSRKGMLIQ